MGATLAPVGNREYCELRPQLIRRVSYDCQCEGKWKDCPHCQGKGKVIFEDREFEVHLSYSTLHTIHKLVDSPLEGDVACATLNPADLLANKDRLNRHFYHIGPVLVELAQEANRRGVLLYWV